MAYVCCHVPEKYLERYASARNKNQLVGALHRFIWKITDELMSNHVFVKLTTYNNDLNP